MMKDETRNTFGSFVDGLPSIKKPKVKGSSPPPPPVPQIYKKVKRKASIPTSMPRMAQSMGPSVLNTEGSQEDLMTAAKTNSASVTKGTN